VEIKTPKGLLQIVPKDSTIPLELEGSAFIIDKPIYWSSFDVVRFLKWSTKIRKIGHAGTLDPLATGVLVCLIGRQATRHAEYLTGQSKVYDAEIELGKTTKSFDSESEVNGEFSYSAVQEADVQKVAASFVGEYNQIPPMYSAKKVGGERLYKKARRGESIERKRSPVTIHSLVITGINLPTISTRIDCSKGTYIRCIADDFGKRLDSGAYLSGLRRISSGDFHVNEAWAVGDLSEALGSNFDDFRKPRRLRDFEDAAENLAQDDA